jgi:hypothetical protein
MWGISSSRHKHYQTVLDNLGSQIITLEMELKRQKLEMECVQRELYNLRDAVYNTRVRSGHPSTKLKEAHGSGYTKSLYDDTGTRVLTNCSTSTGWRYGNGGGYSRSV